METHTLSPADWILLLDGIPAALFLLYYGLLVPWYRDKLGIAVFSFAFFVCAILALIAWSVLTGERAAEPVRIVLYTGLGVAMLAKFANVVIEQQAGRLARRRQHQPRKDRVNA
jgi:hypothetical protein